MKNIFRFLMAVAILFTASCAKEDISSSIGGGEVEMTFTVDLPELGTRAYGEGKLAKKLTVKVFESTTNEALTALDRTVTSDTGTFTFQLVLLKGMKYDIVLWAQDPTCNYYQLNGKVVTMDYTDVDANDEKRDAFYYYVQEFDPAVNTPSFSLTRPFAQLNAAVSQSDMDAVKNSKVELTTSTVKVKTYTTLNIATGDVDGETTVEFNATTMPKEAFNGNYTLLSMNYILVPQTANGKMLSNVEFTFKATKNGSETAFTGTSYQDVPLKRNYRTNILGSLLTKPTDFEVKIDADFLKPDQAPEKLFLAAVQGGEVTLTEDVILTQPLVVESDMILDLNGKTVTAPASSAFVADKGGKLTIKNGNVIAYESVVRALGGEVVIENGTFTQTGTAASNPATYRYAVDCRDGGKITVNGGTFASNNGVINVNADSEVVINGGNFENTVNDAITRHFGYISGKLTINDGEFKSVANSAAGGCNLCIASSSANIVINGGNFTALWSTGSKNQIIEAYASGGKAVVTGGIYNNAPAAKYIADGYEAVKKDGLYYVVAEGATVVANKDEIKDALTAAIGTGETNVVIDAAGANIGDLNYGLTQATIPAGTTVTICNANVEGKSYGNGINGTVIFENCTFNNPNGAYSIHFDNGSGDVIFKNCKLYGWNSFGASLHSVSFEGCSLNGNGTYALIRSYVALSLKDCTINTTNANHTDNYNEGVETVDGATLTETNVVYEINNTASIYEALKNGKNVVLTEDIETEAATTAPYGNKYAFKMDGGVLDGNGNELKVECYGDDYGIMTSGGTIKNLTIKEGCRAVMIMYPQQDIILDNVKIGGDGVLYPINTGEGGADGVDLIVTNSVLAGWTSYGLIASASFTNVEFKQGTYYNNIYGRVLKPYVNTTLTNCSFVKSMNLDLSALTAGHKVTMKNCTVDGQVITVDTFTIPTSDAQYDTELFTVDLPSWATSINDCIVFE